MDNMDVNKLWQNFVDTISNHYSDFSGRVDRAQFWYFILVYVLVGVVVQIVGGIVGMGALVRGLYGLALLFPCVGMTARRLQDTGKPGSWAWLLAVPVAVTVVLALFAVVTVLTLGFGAVLFLLSPLLGLVSLAAVVVLIYLCVQPGTPGPNEYGPQPAAWTPGSSTKPPAPAAS